MPSSASDSDVAGDEQAVVAPYHRCSLAALSVCSMAASDLGGESLPAESLRVPADDGRRRSGASAASRRPAASACGPAPRHQHAGLAGNDGFERAALRARHHRPAAGLRLDGHNPEVLLARQDDGGGARGTARGSRRSCGCPRNSTPRGRGGREPGAVRPVADDAQRVCPARRAASMATSMRL